MMPSVDIHYLRYACIGVFCFFFGSSFILLPIFSYWHDQQRVAQLLLCATCALAGFYVPVSPFSAVTRGAVLCIFLLGGLGAFFARYIAWALYELAVFAGLFFVFTFVWRSVAVWEKCHRYILVILMLVAAVNSVQFLAAYSAAFSSRTYNLDAGLLYSGFSNPRVLNQFQALVFPVLSYLVFSGLKGGFNYAKLMAGCAAGVLLVQWVVAFTLGGRGLWFSLAASHVLLIIFFSRYWRLLVIQLVVGFVAWLAYFFMFTVVPEYLGITPELFGSLRTGLSAREFIWGLAWDVFKEHPWLGVGPMHFSGYINPVAAHPHQVILQWLAEWGGPATIIAIVLVIRGMLSGLQYVRQQKSSALDAALWMCLLNVLLLAQVDGVFVMPYTQTWLSVIAGLACARWVGVRNFVSSGALFFFNGLAVFAFFVCAYIVFMVAPEYLQVVGRAAGQIEGDIFPRFWSNGFIP